MKNYKFFGKYVIKADIRCLTGLHIGGTDEGFEIGGIDNPVIKDPISGYPYIPGSSLKGKLRSLLEWVTKHKDKVKENGSEKEIERIRVENMMKEKDGKLIALPCDCGLCDVCIIFGCSASTAVKEPTRLTIRDSFPKGMIDSEGRRKEEDSIVDGTIAEWRKNLGEKIYTEAKTENAIDRLTSEANPRTIERVPADSAFELEMIFDIYCENDYKKIKKVFEGMLLLEDGTLGGGGSRGSGKVKFENFQIIKRGVGYYTNNEKEEMIDNKNIKSVKDILEKFNDIFKQEAEG